jgi:ParB family chromosome partitioning protein
MQTTKQAIMSDIFELPLTSLEVGNDRARDLDPAWAEGLAGIIAAQGLTNPITVRQTEAGYRLVTGLHRVAAYRLLERDTIPARLSGAATEDEARLEEVMENLGRADLIALDRCHHLYDLKQVYERLHPETKAGVAGALAKHGSASEMFSFAESTAEQIGLSKRAIQIAVKIWIQLAPAIRQRLVGTDLARKQTELKALSELKPAQQVKVLNLILSEDHPGVQNVAGALAFLDGGVQPTGEEKRLQAIRESIKGLPEPVFDRLVAENADRMIAALKRQGRI